MFQEVLVNMSSKTSVHCPLFLQGTKGQGTLGRTFWPDAGVQAGQDRPGCGLQTSQPH